MTIHRLTGLDSLAASLLALQLRIGIREGAQEAVRLESHIYFLFLFETIYVFTCRNSATKSDTSETLALHFLPRTDDRKRLSIIPGWKNRGWKKLLSSLTSLFSGHGDLPKQGIFTSRIELYFGV
jgi:hypothetical protein